jgi:acetoacetyl-CoA reductase
MDETAATTAPRVALVTGAMGSLGTAICRRLCRAGFTVAATYSPSNRHPQAWLSAQRDEGCRMHAYRLDVADYADAEWVMEKILAEQGRIDVVVNNAGVIRDRNLCQMSADEWHTVLRTNLDSLFNVSKPAVDQMAQRRWGRVINISSVTAQSGAFGQTNYAAAKAGMHGFTKALALEVARYGITVNTISPGILRSSLSEGIPADIMQSTILPAIPLGRLGEVDEVAGLVAYLASDAAGFVTGANFAINGGQHMC